MRSIKHLGDICKINGANIEKVDVITFGAPCQDISIAGKRDGIKHTEHGDEKTTRSGLFFEALRIIREMREDDEKRGRAIQFIRPRYAIYENVGGLTSSNNGRDFQKVLTEFVKIVEPDAPEIPMPEKGGWPHADAIYGVGANGEPFSIAWRLHDAAKWGVPQRRKRYCVLADFNGFSAAEILFDPQFERMPARGMSITPDRNLGTDRRPEVQTQPESLSGDSAESGAAGKGTAAFAGSGSEAAIDGRIVCYGISAFDSNAMKSPNPHSGIYEATTARTLDLNGGSPACNQGGMAVVCLNDQGGSNMDISEGVTGTLRAQDHGHPPLVMTIDPRQQSMVCQEDLAATLGANAYKEPQVVVCLNPWDSQSKRIFDPNGTGPTLNSGTTEGMNIVPSVLTVYENHSQDSRYKELGDICQTVSATYGMGGNNQPLVLSAIPVEGNGARPSHQGDGYGNDGDPSFTLNAVERHGVGIAIPINTMVGTRDNEEKRTCLGVGEDGDPQFTLSAAHSHAVCIQTYSLQRSDEHKESDKAHTLSARDYKDATDLVLNAPYVAKALRAKANLQCREDGETYVVAFAQNQRDEVRDLGDKSGSIAAEPGMKQQTFIASVDCRNGKVNEEVNGTLQAKEQGQNLNSNNVILIWPEVRRLTPLECTRLQGFPDGWLDIGDWTDEKGKAHKDADSPKYKAAGNSIALPFWSWLARRICAQYERPITMASLFDGIGGFPLAFERCGAKAVWASEIEPYPIAVTKKHFPEEQQ